jgi:hypothetical protein
MCNTNIYNTHYMSTNPNDGQKNDKQMQTEETLKCEEYKREKVEVIECQSDFEENIFLRDDTPYEKPNHYLDDTDEDDDKATENNLLTINDLYKKDILYAPIFLESSLPRKGWIQGCVVCGAKTSNTTFYIDDTYETFGYMVYCCKFCKRAKKRNIELEIEYNDLVINYIDTYRDEIYRSITEKQ